ncbi:MAG TPA: L-seryl-tRNA(Sec) selenium transferase [Pyrinomonadaceae bacterium]|jgi:L-seryl-tRNA(Ser) seleniumtransferase|nr:L-seryl-tRNA(Sec) selenium transferase [Pyrinomonadaceae bacterium]
MTTSDENNIWLRALPSIDALLKTETAAKLAPQVGASKLASLARQATEHLRQEIIIQTAAEDNGKEPNRAELLKQAESRLLILHEAEIAGGLRRVINATGVILHTNLGRAPLTTAARDAILNAAGYCTLEYDIVTGTRGSRGARAEQLLVDLTDAEGALIVNNCAAAAVLVLNTFSRDAETIVSRGELVEIGGDFRVPDVMAQSGALMIEVGTTNRTRLTDYESAINQRTRMIMRVHTSNYRIVGFTKTPSLSELAELAHKARLPLYEDAGSGALIDFDQFGIESEPIIRQSLKQGADLVSFSGDKLLGGPQAGLIVGRRELIEAMRRNPLYRALRADKLRLAGIEATLAGYARGELPSTVEMIAMSPQEIEKRAKRLFRKVCVEIPEALTIETVASESAVGGGSAPTSSLPTTVLAVACEGLTADQVADKLRQWNQPIIARIADDRVLIDLRTVSPSEEKDIEMALRAVAEH